MLNLGVVFVAHTFKDNHSKQHLHSMPPINHAMLNEVNEILCKGAHTMGHMSMFQLVYAIVKMQPACPSHLIPLQAWVQINYQTCG